MSKKQANDQNSDDFNDVEFPAPSDTYAAPDLAKDGNAMKNSSNLATLDPSEPEEKLWTLGFVGLLLTQWLTAINDNVFRWLAIDIGKDFLPTNPSLALTLGSVGFVAPFLVFAAPAGFLADRFSKRSVIVICKIMEIVAMSIGLTAIWYSQFNLLIFTVFLMGAQTALFSPSKLGILPEFLSSRKLSEANGWMGLATMTATVIGMFVGGFLKDSTGYLGREQNFWMPQFTLLGLAVIGTSLSWFIPKTAAANPNAIFNVKTVISWLTFQQAFRDIKELFDRRALFYVACGVVFFWTIAGVAQLNIDVISSESGGVLASDRTPLLISLVFGVALGNVLAGILSRGKIELGLVPIGCFTIVFFGLLLGVTPSAFYVDNGPLQAMWGTDATWRLGWACMLLFGLGIGSGLYDVPLASYLQHRAPAKSRGAILSASNFLIFGVMMIAFLGFNLLRAKVTPGTWRNVPEIAKVVDSQNKDVMQIERFQDRLEIWNQLWLEKVANDSALIAQQEKIIQNSKDPDDLKTLRELVQALADKRPPLSILTQGIDSPDDRKAVLGLGMWQELVARGINEMQPPLIATGKQSARPTLEIDRVSFGKAYARPTDQEAMTDADSQEYWPRLAASVYDQSLYQPLFTSRGVFLLIALVTAVVFMVYVKVLGKNTLSFVSSWIGGSPETTTATGLNNLGESPVVFLFQDAGRSNIEHFEHALKCPLIVANWKSDKQSPAAQLPMGVNQVTIEPSIRTFKNARGSDARPVLKALQDGLSVIMPLFASRETRLNQTPPENLNVILHQCRQAGYDVHPVTINRDPTSDPPNTAIHIGPVIQSPGKAENLIEGLSTLGNQKMSESAVDYTVPAELMILRCKQRSKKMKIADSTGQEMTGTQVLMRTAILKRLLDRNVLAKDEQNVGLLLPPSAGAVLANMALALGGRTSVNLNYSVTADVINECIRQGNIKHVLTTRKVMEKLNITLDATPIYLEELREKVTLFDKLAGVLVGYVLPANMLVKMYSVDKQKQDDVLTLIFTSGSTGQPKGVMLTNRNIACVIDGIDDAVHLTEKDVIVGVLPFFHSFGFAVPLWTVLGLDIAGVYHFNPLDPSQIGKLCKKYSGTVLLATPTFLRTYMKRIDADDFKTLDVVVAGAEKLPTELSDAFESKYGVRPVEGYGATELSPLVSVNQPASRVAKGQQQRIKEGTVGLTITNVSTKVLDLDSGQPVPAGAPGMLWIKGPNVMKGYLGQPELTNEVIVDGWYNTGDVAFVDDGGFIHITGRLSRFSKIGGEMVPHILVEQHLNEIVAKADGDMKCAVSSAPDQKKGEKLVVLHLPLEMTVDQVRTKLIQMGIPSLFIPAGNSFYEIDELPMLGTGKLDLKKLKDIAAEKTQG